jgi:uncharacterized protein (DUF2235 family)
MARQLVVCLDGTGNRFSDLPTNVLRLLRCLPDESDKLVSYYDQGVGTFGLKETLFEWQKVPSRICGLAFGWGISQVIESAYSFLARNYLPGDELYLFGFSRGAYAVRALAAMIHAVGLVEPHQLNLFEYAWAILTGRDRKTGKPDFHLQNKFKATFGRVIPIRLLGLFDTVKSIGWFYDPTSIAYSFNNPSVAIVRHAISIDECRCLFRQNLWSASQTSTNLKEVWFAGVHSDIGGGYPESESQLSLISLRWMLGEGIANGLRVDLDRCHTQLHPAPEIDCDPSGEMHKSLEGWWNVAEWLPQYGWDAHTKRRRYYLGALTPLRKPRHRLMLENSTLHRSVQQRLADVPSYRPPNLPASPVFVDDDAAAPS